MSCCATPHRGTHEEFRTRKRLIEKKYRDTHPHATWSEERKTRRRNTHTQVTRRLQRRGRAFIQQLKSRPCMDCGRSYEPCVMDFDHVRGQKEFELSAHVGLAIQTLQAEADKCDVVCANCHRLREERRRDQRD